MKRILMVIVGLLILFPWASVNALPVVPGPSDGEALQEIFDRIITNGSIDAIGDQSEIGSWCTSEAGVDAYIITKYTDDNSVMGIYSTSNPEAKKPIFSFGADNAVGFCINDLGALWIDGEEVEPNFGETFGFYSYYLEGGLYSHTQDYKNDPETGYGDTNTLALRYLAKEGLSLYTMLDEGTTVDAMGNNDWILAFEGQSKLSGGDGDFNDGVFYLEDISPVPEPAMLFLLGALLSLISALIRKKVNETTVSSPLGDHKRA